jgi:murein DD-endopeptidase MepM/ murein hydrolase activator NlpD
VAHTNDCGTVPGLVRIDNLDGYQETYLHLQNVQVSDGQIITRGQYLGDTGEAEPCVGGHASGPHVHFSVWCLRPSCGAASYHSGFDFSDAESVDWNAQQISDWALDDGSPETEYAGCMTPIAGGIRRCPTASITNDGSSACPANDSAISNGGSVGLITQSAYFNWYYRDHNSAWNVDNVHMYNPSATSTATGKIKLPGAPDVAYSVGPGQEKYYPFQDPSGGGPLQVVADAGTPAVLTSKRTNLAASFNEVNGLANPGTTLYFPYYGKVGCYWEDNIHVLNPNAGSTQGSITIPGATAIRFTLQGGQEGFYGFPPGTVGGPVKISVDAGYTAVEASQRVTYNQTFDEVNAMNPAKAFYTLYLMWYGIDASYTADWIHVVNPGPGSSTVTLTLVGSQPKTQTIQAGGEWHVELDPSVYGPVLIQATSPVLPSQRVVYRDGFSEVNAVSIYGVPTTLHFNWYGHLPNSGWTTDNIHLVNTSDTYSSCGSVTLPGQPLQQFTIGPNGSTHISFPSGTAGGPITIQVDGTCGPVIPVLASQRVNYFDSFHEVNALELG